MQNLVKIKSSNIEAIGYNLETKELFVLFTGGGLYKYFSVDQKIYDDFIKAPSIGKYFYASIRSNKQLKYEKIEFKNDKFNFVTKCKKCGYEINLTDSQKYNGYCWQCWIDKDSPSQKELEQKF